MPNYKVVDADELDLKFKRIADSVRAKTGKTEEMSEDDIPEEIRGISGGSGGENFLEDLIEPPSFEAKCFPEDYELTLDMPFRSVTEETILPFTYAFKRTKGIKKVTLKGNINGCKIDATHMFYETRAKIIDISDFRFIPSTLAGFVQNAPNVTSIVGLIDATHATSMNLAFSTKNSPLVDVGFVPNTIRIGIDFYRCAKLSDNSIDSIIKGLADLTDTTTQTLTLHADIKAKLTDTQIATITNKNWTLA